jgi:S1-C subfamily serine protease
MHASVSVRSTCRKGRRRPPAHCRLGLVVREVDEEAMSVFGLSSYHGVVALEVLEGSPAWRAGLERGDVILACDGLPVESAAQLRDMVVTKRAGRSHRLTVERDGFVRRARICCVRARQRKRSPRTARVRKARTRRLQQTPGCVTAVSALTL